MAKPLVSDELWEMLQPLAELGPVGDAAALGLVQVLAGHGVAVVLGVVAQGPQLGGHGQVHVLAVAGDPGVEGAGVRGWNCCLTSYSSC